VILELEWSGWGCLAIYWVNCARLITSLVYYSARSYSFAEYWKHFMAHLNGVHVFGYNSTGSEPIWIKFGALWVHCLPLAVADFGRDLHRSKSEAIFCFLCEVNNARLYWLPVGQPNFRKFAHNTWICEVVNPFRTKFWKSSHEGSFFFPKKANFSIKSPMTSNFRWR